MNDYLPDFNLEDDDKERRVDYYLIEIENLTCESFKLRR